MKKFILALCFLGIFSQVTQGNFLKTIFAHERACWSSPTATAWRAGAAYVAFTLLPWRFNAGEKTFKKIRYYLTLYYTLPALVFWPARILALRAIKNHDQHMLDVLRNTGLVGLDKKHSFDLTQILLAGTFESFSGNMGDNREWNDLEPKADEDSLFNEASKHDQGCKKLLKKWGVQPKNPGEWIFKYLNEGNLPAAREIGRLNRGLIGGHTFYDSNLGLLKFNFNGKSQDVIRFVCEHYCTREDEFHSKREIISLTRCLCDCKELAPYVTLMQSPIQKIGETDQNNIFIGPEFLYRLLVLVIPQPIIDHPGYDQDICEQEIVRILQTHCKGQGALGIQRLEWMISLLLHNAWNTKHEFSADDTDTILPVVNFDADTPHRMIEYFFNAAKQAGLLPELRKALEQLFKNPEASATTEGNMLQKLQTFEDFKACVMRYSLEPELHGACLALGWDYTREVCCKQSHDAQSHYSKLLPGVIMPNSADYSSCYSILRKMKRSKFWHQKHMRAVRLPHLVKRGITFPGYF